MGCTQARREMDCRPLVTCRFNQPGSKSLSSPAERKCLVIKEVAIVEYSEG